MGVMVEKFYNIKPMSDERLKSLSELGYTRDTVFEDGKYEALKNKLLDVGGEAVILCFYLKDGEELTLLNEGKFFDGYFSVLIRGLPRECHDNSEKLASKQPHYDLYFGFALSEDGAWRQHSWVWNTRGQEVLETTEKRLAYYGYKVV